MAKKKPGAPPALKSLRSIVNDVQHVIRSIDRGLAELEDRASDEEQPTAKEIFAVLKPQAKNVFSTWVRFARAYSALKRAAK